MDNPLGGKYKNFSSTVTWCSDSWIYWEQQRKDKDNVAVYLCKTVPKFRMKCLETLERRGNLITTSQTDCLLLSRVNNRKTKEQTGLTPRWRVLGKHCVPWQMFFMVICCNCNIVGILIWAASSWMILTYKFYWMNSLGFSSFLWFVWWRWKCQLRSILKLDGFSEELIGIVECSNSSLGMELVNLIWHQVKGRKKPDKEEKTGDWSLLKLEDNKSEKFPWRRSSSQVKLISLQYLLLSLSPSLTVAGDGSHSPQC